MSRFTDPRRAIDDFGHQNYLRVVDVACHSHRQNRSTAGISTRDVELARLYSYAFRSQAIGAFHAARDELEHSPAPAGQIAAIRRRATESLAELTNMAIESVPSDYRAVLSTFYRYDRGLRRVLDSLAWELDQTPSSRLEAISNLLIEHVHAVIQGCGVCTARDDVPPRQNGYVVPGLGITIIPLVYGDHHSWNLAYLTEGSADVPPHFHACGVEIHLGYSPLAGRTLLGRHYTRVQTGYAMPIAANTVHGWFNDSDQPHHVPFIFGSQTFGGWGIFQDVVPEGAPVESFATEVRRDSEAFRHMVLLENEIQASADNSSNQRRVIIGGETTRSPGAGGLELAVSNSDANGLRFDSDDFRIVSVVRGAGVVSVGSLERPITRHDHFGIPAGMSAAVRATSQEPLVVLDAVLRR